jgi:hypothetical protein
MPAGRGRGDGCVCGRLWVGLFGFFTEQLEEELLLCHLFTFGAVDALEECGDDAFLDG